MSTIDFYSFDRDEEQNYACRVESEVDERGLESMVARISAHENLTGENRVCYMFGEGGLTRNAYIEVSGIDGTEVAWKGFFGPMWLYPASFIAASQGALVKITKTSALQLTCRLMTNLSLATIYSFSSKLEDVVVLDVKRNRWRSNIDQLISRDPSHFKLMIDGGNNESSTGIYFVLTCGPDCPEDIIKVANTFGK